MGRTRLDRVIALLKKEINRHRLLKKRILDYVETVKNKCLKKEITYYEYETLIHQKLDGKTIQEWLDYYDFHINNFEKKIERKIRHFHLKKFMVIASIILIPLFLFSLFYFIPSLYSYQKYITGNTVDSLNVSSNFSFKNFPENFYTFVTGLIVSDSPIEVSPSEKATEAPLEASPTLEPPRSKTEDQPQEQPSDSPIEVSPSEKATEAPQEASPTLEPPRSETEENNTIVNENKSFENKTKPDQESAFLRKIPDIHIQKNSYSDIKILDYFSQADEFYFLQTQNILSSTYDHTIRIQAEENFTGTRKGKIIVINGGVISESNFFDITISESSVFINKIPDIHIQKNSYSDIKIGDYFSQADEFYFLQTKDILSTTYDHTIRIQAEENFIGTRKGKIIVNNGGVITESNFFTITVAESLQANATIPKEEINISKGENVSIPESNLTVPENITKVNITGNTSVNTTQYKAVIGKPVKWKKEFIPEGLGNLTLKLPKDAENISVKKLSQETYSEMTEEAPQSSPSQKQEEPLPSEELTNKETESMPQGPVSEVNKTEESGTEEKIEKEINTTVETKEQNQESIDKKETVGITGGITGQVIFTVKESDEGEGFFQLILQFIKSFFSKISAGITGRAITPIEETQEIEVEIEVNEIATYAVEYETPAPQAYEEEISARKKQIIISGPDTIHYENVLAYTQLTEEVTQEKIHLYHVVNETREDVALTFYDTNNNSLIDYIEWVVPSLSNQTYELIIKITKADHLDEQREFISDIYPEVSQLDDVWSETILEGHYVRVVFEKNLTSNRDITLYPRTVSGTPRIEVYENNRTELIAEFSSLIDNTYNKVYLTQLVSESQDVFDLKIVNGSIEFDHIIDPVNETKPGAGTNPAYNGTLTETTLSILTSSSLNSGDYAKITNFDSNPFRVPGGSSTVDVFLFVNFTIPQGYYEINVSVWHNSSSSTGGSKTGIALWNFSAGSWMDVLNTSAVTLNGLKSYNVSTNLLDENNFVSKNVIRAMVFEDSNANTNFSVDQIWVNTTFSQQPNVTINSPLNQTYTTNTISFNVTAVDETDMRFVNYTLNGGLTNFSMKNASTSPTQWNDTNLTMAEGSTTVIFYAYDKWGSLNNSERRTFFIDKTNPNLTINFPTNNTNTSDTLLDINFTASDNLALSTCWFSNDTYLANTTLATCGTNITTVVWAEGIHNVTIWANDSANNINRTSISFRVDITNPGLTINFPTNNTNTIDTLLDVNYTASDNLNNSLSTCWFSNDTYLANTTLTNCGTNITTVVWATGPHNVTVWANDSSNNINRTSVSFTIDTTPPDLAINFPTNNTNTTDTLLDVNYTASNASLDLSSCWYSNDSYLANTSLANCVNITTVVWAEGPHNVTIWANDSSNNINRTSISFRVDTINPSLTINFPSNNTDTSDTLLDINYTASDVALSTCWFSNDTYLANTTLTNCGTNITTVVWATGPHNVTVWANDSSNNINKTSVTFNITVTNTAPQIRYVWNNSMSPNPANGLNAGPLATNIVINFSVYDADGTNGIDNATALINFTKSGETMRVNSSCLQFQTNGVDAANYTCNVTMWWWDGAGAWNINAFIADTSANNATNTSTVLSVGETIGFEVGPSALSWLSLSPGMTNQTANNDPIVLNNTGNKYITLGNITVNATNLRGETTSTLAIWAGNITINVSTGGSPPAECDGPNVMTAGNYLNLTGAYLERNNYTVNNGTTGQEQLYVCFRKIGAELSAQAYSTQNEGAWTIRILAVAFGLARRKKKKRNHESKIENLTIPSAIFSDNLGCLEAIIKYMKENLDMSYSEIADILNRDDRTIWTAYQKAIKKQPQTVNLEKTIVMLPVMKIEKIFIVLPVSIFKNEKFTILEAIVVYLKEKGLKYNEISKLLNRDQRNIWTTYAQAMKKTKR